MLPADGQVCFPDSEALCHLITKPWISPDQLESSCTNLEPARPAVTPQRSSLHPDAEAAGNPGGQDKSREMGERIRNQVGSTPCLKNDNILSL